MMPEESAVHQTTSCDDAVAYVAGTLSEAERQHFEQKMTVEPDCRQAVRQTRALKRLLSEYYTEKRPSASSWDRVAAAMDRDDAHPSPGRGWTAWLGGVAVAGLLAVQLVLIHEQVRPVQTLYQPMGAEATTRPVFQVRFNPQATQGEVTRLLQRLDLEVVGGPGAAGLYRLAPPATLPADRLVRLKHALSRSALVVEVVGP